MKAKKPTHVPGRRFFFERVVLLQGSVLEQFPLIDCCLRG